MTLLGFVWQTPLSKSSNVLRTPKWASEFRPYGAYVDELQFVIYPEGGIVQAMLALQNGDIDAYDERVPVEYLANLVRDPNIEVTFTPNVRYRGITLNCQKFPLNITAFRRTMAFGYDKYRANMECIGGVGQSQDSYIPISVTEWEVESEMTEHFYEADFVSGNRSLERAGFKDLDRDGWREYDKNDNGIWDPGVDFDDDEYAEGWSWAPGYGVIELYATSGYDPQIRACHVMVDGLAQMGIRSYVVEGDFFGLPPEGYDRMEFSQSWAESVPITNPPELLYDNFRTGGKHNNYYHFSNSTIDAVLDQMNEATTPDDVKTYAREANRLLTFEQPQIVVYNDGNIGAHRNDRFDGWLEFAGLGTTTGGENWWTPYYEIYKNNPYCATKVHLKGSKNEFFGGVFKHCLSDDISTLNPYLRRTSHEETVFQYIYEKLWNIDPITWDPIPGLAYDWDIEQILSNGDIHNSQKFTFFLYDNVTWHGGEPFTAADVNHSIHMLRDSPTYEWVPPYFTAYPNKMRSIYNVTILDDHTIEIYVNKTGHFEWAKTTNFFITPEHIWRDVTNVSAFTPTNDQIIGTGPYKWNEYVPGEYISLLRHEDWRWDIRDVPVPQTSKKSTTQGSATESSTIDSTSGSPLIMVFGALMGILLIKRLKRKIKS